MKTRRTQEGDRTQEQVLFQLNRRRKNGLKTKRREFCGDRLKSLPRARWDRTREAQGGGKKRVPRMAGITPSKRP